MLAALTPLCVIAFAALCQAAAESPYTMVGEGLMSSNPALSPAGGKGVRYAGPIVYSNEKPPIIYFPPPPKNAKPGLFGKNKSPKSIKYVPMPHHDLPVLIYTSDKVPPIHMVHPPNGNESPPSHSPSFRFPSSPKEEFGPSFRGPGFRQSSSFGTPGSLSSTYGLQGEPSARIVTSSYEIPFTSYGHAVNQFGSPLGSLDLASGSSNEEPIRENRDQQQQQQQPLSSNSYGQPQPPVSDSLSNSQRPAGGYFQVSPPKKSPPHIMYAGHRPIHIFNEHDVYVKAPKEAPHKTFDELPPKASVGPPKSSFGASSVMNTLINSFGPALPQTSYRPQQLSAFGPPQPQQQRRRPSFTIIPAWENIVSSASNHNPSPSYAFGSITPNYNSPQRVENEQNNNETPNYAASSNSNSYGASSSSPPYGGPSSPGSFSSYGGPSYGGPHSYSFAPNYNSYSFGPFSIEYGPASEPFMSYSEPAGSLSNIYGSMTGNRPDDGWMQGPPPPKGNNAGGPIKENAWSPPPGHGPMPGPSPMHSSVMFPSSPFGGSKLASSPFGSSKLASLFSSFKLKRPKPKYAIAPKSMHKPPIIIYYGKKPPVHVYQKHEDDEITSASSTVSVSSESPSSSSSHSGNSNENNVQQQQQQNSVENVDLTYGAASQSSEVRVAAPPPQPPPVAELKLSSAESRHEPMSYISANKPAIIAAKPVVIFPSGELQPSIYMARNSLNTIFVSDLSGSGARAIKTYIVRSGGEDQMGSPSSSQGKLSVTQTTVLTPTIDLDSLGSISSISNRDGSIAVAAEERISSSQAQPLASPSVSKNKESEAAEFSITPAILLSAVEQGPETQAASEQQQQIEGEETQAVPVYVQSPSTFQSSLSKAEKESNEASPTSYKEGRRFGQFSQVTMLH